MNPWEAAAWVSLVLIGLMALIVVSFSVAMAAAWHHGERHTLTLNRHTVRLTCRQIRAADDEAIWAELERTP